MVIEQFRLIVSCVISQTIQVLIERHGWPEDEALIRFMGSDVCRILNDEETKVWHFSPLLLATLYEEEMEGRLEWPE